MDYGKSIAVPKNTLENNPAVSEIVLPKGIIKEVGYFFPEGCKGLAHLTIWYSGIQLYPRSQNLSYYGDNLYRKISCNFQLPEAFNILTFKCWNLDDTWQHTIITFIVVLNEETPSWFKQLFFGLTGGKAG